MNTFNIWTNVIIPIIILIISGLISWRVSVAVFKKQRKAEFQSSLSKDVLIPLATSIAVTLEDPSIDKMVYPIKLAVNEYLSSSVIDLSFLEDYIKAPINIILRH